MAKKKAGGSTSNLRDSKSKRLGVKIFGGQWAKTGSILIRQRGSKVRPGLNVEQGKDDTLFALTSGLVQFSKKQVRKFTGKLETTKYVHVIPQKKDQK